MKHYISILFLFVVLPFFGQQKLTLEECQTAVTKNYPLAKQLDLYTQKGNFEKQAIEKGNLPKIDINAQATYQSDVIGLPIALPGMEPQNKDQYRATLDVNQIIYNGGAVDATAKLRAAQSKTQQQQVEVNLYQLKSRINHYYFSILLLQEKRALLVSKNELLLEKTKEVKSGVKYGAILPASELILEAEMLKIKQQLTEIKFENIKLLQSLSDLTFTKIDSETVVIPPTNEDKISRSNRPELTLYDLQNEQIDFSKSILSKSALPRLNAFGQAGYGNPGLNMLDNSFQGFYIVGLKANWNILDWGKNKKDLNALEIAKEIALTEKETFELNNLIEVQQGENDIKKLQELLTSDYEIIEIRSKIAQSANAQMKNGVITTSEYLTEFINLFEARNVLKTHEVQLSLAKSNYEIIKGN